MNGCRKVFKAFVFGDSSATYPNLALIHPPYDQCELNLPAGKRIGPYREMPCTCPFKNCWPGTNVTIGFENTFAEKTGEKIGGFDSKFCHLFYAKRGS
jgi:hypothetical protein